MNDKKIIDALPLMSAPNEEIPLYNGNITLLWNDNILRVTGSIVFKWFPYVGSILFGDVKSDDVDVSEILSLPRVDVHINDQKIGQAQLTECSLKIGTSVSGFFKQLTLGDKSVTVTEIKFAIPNLRGLYGTIQPFDDGEYVIEIHTIPGFMSRENLLRQKGGYLFTYEGRLRRKDGRSMKYREAKDAMRRFGYFVSLINGRRCFPMFLTGYHNDEGCWRDCDAWEVDMYKGVDSCFKSDPAQLAETWKKFSHQSRSPSTYDFLKSAIHWYIEANLNSGRVEGAIILAQTAIELIYNWLIVENLKIIRGENSTRLDASNKIRILLSHMRVGIDVPSDLVNLKAVNSTFDGPESFVTIRNAIVHSQESKRIQLDKMADDAKIEALRLAIWYIELSLLYILDSQGQYLNRLTGKREKLPWDKSANK